MLKSYISQPQVFSPFGLILPPLQPFFHSGINLNATFQPLVPAVFEKEILLIIELLPIKQECLSISLLKDYFQINAFLIWW